MRCINACNCIVSYFVYIYTYKVFWIRCNFNDIILVLYGFCLKCNCNQIICTNIAVIFDSNQFRIMLRGHVLFLLTTSHRYTSLTCTTLFCLHFSVYVLLFWALRNLAIQNTIDTNTFWLFHNVSLLSTFSNCIHHLIS